MRSSLIPLIVVAALLTPTLRGQVQVVNPNWNITLNDAGYSDELFDNTPGFEGREYLSGEWAAALSYQLGSGTTAVNVSPQWLTPNFIFPDWATSTNFATSSPITAVELNPDLTVRKAASELNNSVDHVRVGLTYEMIDTTFGMKMGTSRKSAATGSSLDSNRYVFKQTYTITNESSDVIQNLGLFQFLHGLNSVNSLYDDRTYSGPMGTYRYDTTQLAIDPNSATTTFHDYINFASSLAPVAFDNGRYGIEGTDDHAMGKPSVGLHYAVEGNSLANVDYFSPGNLWVSGAQKYLLGNLAAGGSVSFDLLLSVRTGTAIANTGTSSGSANGGSTHPGGVDFSFEDVLEIGDFFVEYSLADADEVHERITHGDFGIPTFDWLGMMQLFEVEFEGTYDGDVTLVFGYDGMVLPPGFDEMTLDMYHFRSGSWEKMNGVVDALANTITVVTGDLSPFSVGAVPEPAGVLALAVLCLVTGRRRQIVF